MELTPAARTFGARLDDLADAFRNYHYARLVFDGINPVTISAQAQNLESAFRDLKLAHRRMNQSSAFRKDLTG